MDQLTIGSSLINEAVENGNIIYVHCAHGHGRSPTMVTAYFIRYQEMMVENAINFVKQRRSEIHIEKIQKEALEKFAQKWK
jgi:protein-tyrosine phosphatase